MFFFIPSAPIFFISNPHFLLGSHFVFFEMVKRKIHSTGLELCRAEVREGDPLLRARAGTGRSGGVGEGSAPPRSGMSLSVFPPTLGSDLESR
jgi:hypothetical protein